MILTSEVQNRWMAGDFRVVIAGCGVVEYAGASLLVAVGRVPPVG